MFRKMPTISRKSLQPSPQQPPKTTQNRLISAQIPKIPEKMLKNAEKMPGKLRYRPKFLEDFPQNKTTIRTAFDSMARCIAVGGGGSKLLSTLHHLSRPGLLFSDSNEARRAHTKL
jgi:hypothetical protein